MLDSTPKTSHFLAALCKNAFVCYCTRKILSYICLYNRKSGIKMLIAKINFKKVSAALKTNVELNYGNINLWTKEKSWSDLKTSG